MPKASLGYELEGDVLVATKKQAQAVALYEKGLRSATEWADGDQAPCRMHRAGKAGSVRRAAEAMAF
jgi:predicted negative regulator of RcsB-dependent stress response